MSGWSASRITILAARRVLPPLLMTPGETVEPAHEGNRARGRAAAGEPFAARAQAGEIGAGAGTVLEQPPFGAHQFQDAVHAVVHAVDEAGGALRLGLDADVEPDRGIEGQLLVQQQVDELVPEVGRRSPRPRNTPAVSPSPEMVSATLAKQLAQGILAGVAGAVEVLGGDDLGGGLGPGSGKLDAAAVRKGFSPARPR